MKYLLEKHLKTEYKYKGRLLNLRVDTVLTPGGREATREVVEHPGAVAVVAITNDKKIVLVSQFRQPTGEVVLELPAGVPNKGEKLARAAKRELLEETGYQAGKIRKVMSGYASPGYANEIIHYFLATGLKKMRANPDEDEYVEVCLIRLARAIKLAKTGQINDNKTALGILLAGLYV